MHKQIYTFFLRASPYPSFRSLFRSFALAHALSLFLSSSLSLFLPRCLSRSLSQKKLEIKIKKKIFFTYIFSNISYIYFMKKIANCFFTPIEMRDHYPLTKEIRLKIFDPIISNSFPVRYYGISSTNLPDIP